MAKIRVQKILSDAGHCSRRAAEALISAGRVKRNGRPVTLGDKADAAKDIITVDGTRIEVERNRKFYYVMLNKPRGYVTTMSDEFGRRNVTELLKGIPARVYPVGRLDRNSEGLLLFTNDGNLANDIMHPSRHISKTYRVTVRPEITDDQLIALSAGMKIDGEEIQPAVVHVLTQEEGRVVLQMTIHEGKNRQIRRMCEAVGLEVARLRRTAIGPLKLGMLAPGKYRNLQPDELRALRNAITKADKPSNAKD